MYYCVLYCHSERNENLRHHRESPEMQWEMQLWNLLMKFFHFHLFSTDNSCLRCKTFYKYFSYKSWSLTCFPSCHAWWNGKYFILSAEFTTVVVSQILFLLVISIIFHCTYHLFRFQFSMYDKRIFLIWYLKDQLNSAKKRL